MLLLSYEYLKYIRFTEQQTEKEIKWCIRKIGQLENKQTAKLSPEERKSIVDECAIIEYELDILMNYYLKIR